MWYPNIMMQELKRRRVCVISITWGPHMHVHARAGVI